MKKTLLLVLVGLGLVAGEGQAALVRNYFTTPTNSSVLDTNYLIITKISTNIQSSGGVIPIGIPIRTTRSPWTNSLALGFYSVSNPAVRGSYVINVWDDSATYYDYTNLLHSGYNTYVVKSVTSNEIVTALGFVPGTGSGGSATNVHVIAGANITVVTNSSSSFTISATGGGQTNYVDTLSSTNGYYTYSTNNGRVTATFVLTNAPDATLPATITSDISGNSATATLATNVLNGLNTTNYSETYIDVNTNRFVLTGAGSPAIDGTYDWNSTKGTWTNTSTTSGIDTQFFPDYYITNAAEEYLYVALVLPTSWAVSTGVGPAPTGAYGSRTNTVTSKTVTNNWMIKVPAGISTGHLLGGYNITMSRGADYSPTSGTIYDHETPGFENAVLASGYVWEHGAWDFTAASYYVTNRGQRVSILSSGHVDVKSQNADYAVIASEFCTISNINGVAALMASGSVLDYGDNGYSIISCNNIFNDFGTENSVLLAAELGHYSVLGSLVGGHSTTNWLDQYIFSWGRRIVTSNNLESVALGENLSLKNTTNAYVIGYGLSSTSNNVMKLGFTGAHLNITSNGIAGIGAGFTGNGAGVTNLSGTNIQTGTINSNKLDAATLALLGTGGGSGSASNVFFTPGNSTVWSVTSGSNRVDVVGTLTNDINAATITSATANIGIGNLTNVSSSVAGNPFATNYYTLTYSGGSNVVVDFSLASSFSLTLTNNAWLIFTNANYLQNMGALVAIAQDATGTRTVLRQTNNAFVPSGNWLTFPTNASALGMISVMRGTTSTNVWLGQTYNFRAQ